MCSASSEMLAIASHSVTVSEIASPLATSVRLPSTASMIVRSAPSLPASVLDDEPSSEKVESAVAALTRCCPAAERTTEGP